MTVQHRPIKKFGVAYLRHELAVGSIEKLFRIKQNHPMIQQRQKFNSLHPDFSPHLD
ncbi:hypothetical protein [Nostoc sp.]|uniref:hypothetical protein n=1 Tax=Nostoc sp. TaxID=1180 RepID=UPI002FFC31BC